MEVRLTEWERLRDYWNSVSAHRDTALEEDIEAGDYELNIAENCKEKSLVFQE
jgi:hypothetical protein